MKIGSLLLAFMLFASLGFASFTYVPSCVTSYSILNQTFIYTEYNGTIACTASTKYSPMQFSMSPRVDAVLIIPLNSSSYRFGEYFDGAGYASLATNSTWIINMSQFSTAQTIRISIVVGGGGNIVAFGNSTEITVFQPATIGTILFNGTHTGTNWNFTNGTTIITIPDTDNMNISTQGNSYINVVRAYVSIEHANKITSTVLAREPASVAELTNQSQLEYLSVSNYTDALATGQRMVRSDFKTGYTGASTTSYCKSLLYFNNPYYGNIQLIPKLTYIPGTDAFGDFYNSTSNTAYIPNNTISYVFDSITSAWYIVPATICTSYALIGSTSTLQYNPTGLTPGATGTIPININDISGSCSYVSASRVITCTGSDASTTLTSLNLSAYASGNSSLACSNGLVGASGTVSCTLPNVNGTYNAFFYGTDSNLLNYLIASNAYTVGSSSQTSYGRDGFILAIILVVVAATVMTASIAVSMVLGCFGLFIAVAFGIIPIETGAVAALFAVVALALAYRLKV